MRATFRGALAALSLMALGGCAGTGVQPLTEPSTASAGPEVQAVLEIVHSDDGRQLMAAADQYDRDRCAVHLQRWQETPERSECLRVQARLADLSGRLEDQMKWLRDVPAGIDEEVRRTTEALTGVRVLAQPGKDPELLTLSLGILRGAWGAWSTDAG